MLSTSVWKFDYIPFLLHSLNQLSSWLFFFFFSSLDASFPFQPVASCSHLDFNIHISVLLTFSSPHGGMCEHWPGLQLDTSCLSWHIDPITQCQDLSFGLFLLSLHKTYQQTVIAYSLSTEILEGDLSECKFRVCHFRMPSCTVSWCLLHPPSHSEEPFRTPSPLSWQQFTVL